jgi:two-component system, OmpR family, sensor histidine kinase ArlS
LDVKEVDSQLLRLIDQNTLYNLLDEKTIFFDDSYEMIYSSLDDEVIFWTKEDLDLLQKENFFYRQIGDNEEVGVHYVFEERCYMIITSANDTYGRRKLEYLLYILLITFSVGSVLVWSSTWILVKKLLAPLDDFKSQLVEISANKLNHRIKGHTNDELGTFS